VKRLLALLAILVLAGCQTGTLETITSPAAVQGVITFVGAKAKPNMVNNQVANVRKFKAELAAALTGTFDSSVLIALINKYTGSFASQLQDAVAVAEGAFAAAEAKFGKHNPQVLAYAQAIVNGLTAAGF